MILLKKIIFSFLGGSQHYSCNFSFLFWGSHNRCRGYAVCTHQCSNTHSCSEGHKPWREWGQDCGLLPTIKVKIPSNSELTKGQENTLKVVRVKWGTQGGLWLQYQISFSNMAHVLYKTVPFASSDELVSTSVGNPHHPQRMLKALGWHCNWFCHGNGKYIV